MPSVSWIRNSSESSVCPLLVHFTVVFIWHHCIFVFILSKACRCHCASALCRILTWLFWGHTPCCFTTGPGLKSGATRVVSLFTLKWGSSAGWCREANLGGRRNFSGRPPAEGWCGSLLVCCVPPVTRAGGDFGHANWKLFSFLGPQLPGLLQISNSCFVWPPSMLSAGGLTATTTSFWSRERACRGKENPVFKSYQYFISHRV